MARSPKYSARQIQQSFFESLGDRDWDLYTINDYQYLKFKIAYAVYGPPTIESDIDNIQNNSGYTNQQYDKILPIYERILSFGKYSANGKNIYMSILFVCKVPGGKLNEDLITTEYIPYDCIEVYPVFKLRKCINAQREGCSIFFDDIGRQYIDWTDYLLNNKLSKGIIVSPLNGRYCGRFEMGAVEVRLHCSYSPACSKMAKARRIGDAAVTTIAVGAVSVIGFSLLAPVAAAVAITANVATLVTSVYSVASSSVSLADRGRHGQSINLKDIESRGYWLNIGAGFAGAVAGAGSQILSKVASEGVVIGNGIKIAHDTVMIAAVVTGGAGFMNSIGSSIIKYKETGILPNNLELFQMASSALFLTNSLINNKMASTIIAETQSGVIYNLRSFLGSGRTRTVFDKVVAETQRITGQGSQGSQGNFEVIQSIGRISNMWGSALKNTKNILERQDGSTPLNKTNPVDPHALSTSSSAIRNEVRNVRQYQTNTENNSAHSQAQQRSSHIKQGGSITMPKILCSFPSLSFSDREIIQDLYKLFSKFSEIAYNFFVEIVNNVFNSITITLLQQSRALTMQEHQLFEELIHFIHSQLLHHSVKYHITINESIQAYFRDGCILMNGVRRLYKEFQTIINYKYQVVVANREIKCEECCGLRFSAN